ncbi:N-6 DNA methylase [Hymenobacter metallicola]|uniref:Uncharacterized protein n=1 Tax=Hymenobacter metallicola TaxID=2563114 RepID=A0A4Z0Q0T6_9BACT|nr:N-6 DNA methylase [Hymenobacter metallicola]TGE22701.1 hypothetical protein E5K02_23510 [Hymenobacter metallicola]
MAATQKENRESNTSQIDTHKHKVFTRDDFSRLLFKCHNIIRNNDKLSPEAAFDEISKILFIKIRYEREQKSSNSIFSEEEFLNLKKSDEKVRGIDALSKPFYQFFFDSTKRAFEKDELFDPNDSLKLRESTFLLIIKELEKYNLSETSDDVKGIAFEEFLGRTFRGELGQFFTPRTVVDYIVEVLDPQEGELICDPCCGSGGFLIKAFEYIRTNIEAEIKSAKTEIDRERSKIENKSYSKELNNLITFLDTETDLQNTNGRLYQLSHNCIFGVDANPRMARTAKMNMIMHGDGHGGVHHHDGLLNINGIFEERFDVILTNPPFGARIDKSLRVTANDIPQADKVTHYKAQYGDDYERLVVQPLRGYAQFDSGSDKPKGKPIVDLFELSNISSSTEVLFLERCLNLLKPGGRMGIVLPEGVLNNSNLTRVRDFIESKAKILNITSLPKEVFMASGATVKASVIFLKKFSVDERVAYQKLVDEKNTNPNIKDIDTIRKAIRTETSYTVPLVEVKHAGISSTGSATENQLPAIAAEYGEYRIKNRLWHEPERPYYIIDFSAKPKISRVKSNFSDTLNKSTFVTRPDHTDNNRSEYLIRSNNSNNRLQFTELKDLLNWSVRFAIENKFNYNDAYPLHRLGDFLQRNKNELIIMDDIEYKRVNIKINNRGVYLRDKKLGRDIATKRQFYLKAGQFVLSKIDARNGALGIAPRELDGAAITNDFLAFDINTSLINPYFLSLLTGTKEFIRFCQSCSSGSTNRQRLDENLFLNVEIPLPPLSKQEDMIKDHLRAQELRAEAEKLEARALANFETEIFKAR